MLQSVMSYMSLNLYVNILGLERTCQFTFNLFQAVGYGREL